jgi:hypothetical protein
MQDRIPGTLEELGKVIGAGVGGILGWVAPPNILTFMEINPNDLGFAILPLIIASSLLSMWGSSTLGDHVGRKSDEGLAKSITASIDHARACLDKRTRKNITFFCDVYSGASKMKDIDDHENITHLVTDYTI